MASDTGTYKVTVRFYKSTTNKGEIVKEISLNSTTDFPIDITALSETFAPRILINVSAYDDASGSDSDPGWRGTQFSANVFRIRVS